MTPVPSHYVPTRIRRTESGHVAASLWLRTPTPMATSVCWAAKPRARKRGQASRARKPLRQRLKYPYSARLGRITNGELQNSCSPAGACVNRAGGVKTWTHPSDAHDKFHASGPVASVWLRRESLDLNTANCPYDSEFSPSLQEFRKLALPPSGQWVTLFVT